MRVALIVIAAVTGIVAVIGGLIFMGLRATEAERQVARAFVFEASTGDIAAAHERFHPALAEEVPEARLAEMFKGARPYADVSFTSFRAVAGEGTTVEGNASTADGCQSSVEVRLIAEQIISFNITPLCRQ